METERFGSYVVGLIGRGSTAAVEGDETEIVSAPPKHQVVDRLSSAILRYPGRVSQNEHSTAEGKTMIALAQIITSLGGVGGLS